jgi:hypothetical protein
MKSNFVSEEAEKTYIEDNSIDAWWIIFHIK